MRLRTPSPSMVVALIALFVALTGTAFAAVTYAERAGSVDGKSAVSATVTTAKAANRLIAANSRGLDKGQIPAKFLDDVPVTQTFGSAFEVVDNATGAANTIGSVAGIGTLTASCSDENQNAGNEDPASTITITNSSGEAINIARSTGGGGPTILPQPNGTVHSFQIRGSTTFNMHIERRGTNMLVNGVVRQDGRGTPAANCLVYGTVLRIER